MKRNCRLAVVGILTLIMVALTACGQSNDKANVSSSEENETERVKDYEPVTIETIDGPITFDQMPQRAVPFDSKSTGIMLALGLEDYIVGTKTNPEQILPEYRDVLSHIHVISSDKGELSNEALLGVDPDFVYLGGTSYSPEERKRIAEEYKKFGIETYFHQSITITNATIEDVYQDIRNIGRIFNVEDRSEILIQSLEDSINDVKKKIESQVGTKEEPLRVFVYGLGEDAPLTAASSIVTNMIEMAGGENIFDDIDKRWPIVSWEEVVNRNPEVIVITDNADGTVEQMKQFLFNHPALVDVDAIKNERIGVLPLDYTFEGVSVPNGLEELAKTFYPDAFE